MVISEAMCPGFGEGGDAIGRPVQRRDDEDSPWLVVGVASDGKVRTLGEAPRDIAAKDGDGNYLATCQAREAVENGLRLDAVGNFISVTVLSVRGASSECRFAASGGGTVAERLAGARERTSEVVRGAATAPPTRPVGRTSPAQQWNSTAGQRRLAWPRPTTRLASVRLNPSKT